MENKKLPDPYKIVYREGSGEIIEKKSRFIATVRSVESEEEASAFIEEMKRKYWDASHNCSAFVIGKRAETVRCSDDGEPGQTAGRPMLEVLLGEGIRNTAVVVTRYFGGTLLGTGGLVRAYTKAVQAGLAACEIVTMRYGTGLRIRTDYNGTGKMQYLMGKRGITAEDTDYATDVTIRLTAPAEEAAGLIREITEATAGRAVIEETGHYYYIDKKKPE